MMKLAIVGRGKLGSALYKALLVAGHTVVDDAITSDLILLCVPDDVIGEVSARYAGHAMAHTSGAHASDILVGNGLKASLHPIQTIRAGAEPDVFHGIPMSVEGDASLVETLSSLATDLGATPLPVTAEQKRSIHLAAVMVSNFTIALHMMADEVLKTSGIDAPSSDLFHALMDRTMANLREVGPMDARTGPAVRGDVETIRSHLAVLDGQPTAIAAYKALSEVLATGDTIFYSRLHHFLRS